MTIEAADIRTISVIGTGAIGASWAAYFLSRGLTVTAYDPAPNGADFLARWHEVNAVVFDIVLRMGGSISAEHGIGVLKRDELPDVKDKTAIELMRAVKAMLDPNGIMNPGKVL